MIGIGAGDPDHLTLQAAKAIERADVFFVLDKGEVKQELVDLREEILRRHAARQYRVVVGPRSGAGPRAATRTSSRSTTGGGAGPTSARA